MKTKDKPQKIIRTSVALPEDLDRAIRELAAKGDRSITREVRRAVERYVESERATR